MTTEIEEQAYNAARNDYVREQLKRYNLHLKDIRAYYIDSCGAAAVRITRDFKVLYKRANGWLYAEGESWLHGGWIDRDLLEQIVHNTAYSQKLKLKRTTL